MQEVAMPRLDINMEKGSVSKWLKREGDQVEKGEPLVEIMSEKVTFEFPSPASGKLYRILVKNDTEAIVGRIIGVIIGPEDDLNAVDKTISNLRNLGGFLTLDSKMEEPSNINFARKKEVKTSPAARVLAREYGIDVTAIKGSGPGGRIVREDVLRLAPNKVKTEQSSIVPLTGMRRVTAERLTYSFKNIPHSFLLTDADMSMAMELHSSSERKTEPKISYNAIFIKATAKALNEYRIFNSVYENGQIRTLNNINIGLAVSTEKGLVVPVINDADKKSVEKVNEIACDLVDKARRGELTLGDVEGGTFTISNLGMFEVSVAIAIINPNQAAILAIGQIEDRTRVVRGEIAVKPLVTLCLSFDHRIADGVPAAQFLRRIKQIVEDPSLL